MLLCKYTNKKSSCPVFLYYSLRPSQPLSSGLRRSHCQSKPPPWLLGRDYSGLLHLTEFYPCGAGSGSTEIYMKFLEKVTPYCHPMESLSVSSCFTRSVPLLRWASIFLNPRSKHAPTGDQQVGSAKHWGQWQKMPCIYCAIFWSSKSQAHSLFAHEIRCRFLFSAHK